MKKIFLLTLTSLLAGFYYPACSQATSGFGCKAGLTISSLGGNGSQFGSAKPGFHAGIYLATIFSDRIALQPELLYSQQGYQVVTPYEYKVNYNYLILPLVFKIYVGQEFTIQLGPQVGYLLSARESSAGNSISYDGVKKFDFGLVAGFGYELPKGLNVAARYNLGLSNTTANSANKTLVLANRVFQLSVGYTFE